MCYREFLRFRVVCAFCFAWLLLCGCNNVNEARQVLWICPKDEKIVFVRTGIKQHQLYVLTETAEQWVLRRLNDGVITEIASGTGIPQAVSPVVLSDDGERCLVGYYTRNIIGHKQYKVAYCDIRLGKTKEIKSVANVLAYRLMRPFSPDGKKIVVSAHRRAWSIDIETDTATQVADTPAPGSGEVMVGYLSNNDIVIYHSKTGLLQHGKPGALIQQGFYPGRFIYYSADNKHIFSATQDADAIHILSFDVSKSHKRTVYAKRSPNAGEAIIYGFQGYNNAQQVTLNIVWPEFNPVYIDSKGSSTEVPLDDTAKSRLMCGVAIWDNDTIAVVDRPNDNMGDSILACSVLK